MKKLFLITALAGMMWGCSDFQDTDTTTHNNLNPGTENPTGNATLALVCSEDTTTRTQIGDDMASVRWSDNDTATIWAQNTADSSWALNGVTFGLSYYRPEWHNAVFVGTADAMPAGDYTYYGVSPRPASQSGTTVTYTLPTTQTGLPDYDILAATPVTDVELKHYDESAAMLAELPSHEMAFKHKCHMLHVALPSNNLWGTPITQLDIVFPMPVVGDVSFDATDPTAPMTLANASTTITIPITGNVRYDHIWAFINPAQLTGDLEFVVRTGTGFLRWRSSIADLSSKHLAAGHITPITIDFPINQLPASINLRLGTNNLGEAPTKVTVTAPEGMLFTNESRTMTVTPNGSDLGTVSFYSHRFGNIAQGATFGIEFESEHAHQIFDEITLPQRYLTGGTTTFTVNIPYLFEENFDDEMNNPAYLDVHWGWRGTDAGINAGWGRDRFSGWSGTGARIDDGGAGVVLSTSTNRFRGNLITSPMSRIKSNCNITVSFRGARTSDDSKFTSLGVYMGKTTTTGAPTGDDAIFNTKTKVEIDYVGGSSLTNIPAKVYSVNLDGIGSNTRLFWRTDDGTTDWFNYHQEYFYFDDMRVSIRP